MSTLVTNFLSYLLTEKRVAHNTYDAYRRDIIQLSDYSVCYLKKEVENVSHAEIVGFIAQLTSSEITQRTIARKIACFKNFFKYIHERYEYPNNAESLETPKLEKRLPHYLSEDEIRALFDAAQEDLTDNGIRNYIMLLLLYSTGVRITELISLKIDDVDPEQQCIKVKGKGSKERLVPVPEDVMKMVQDYIIVTYPRLLIKNKEKFITSYLFPTYYENALHAMSRQSFWIFLKKLSLKAGVTKDFSPHTLRHSLATHLLKNGLNLRSLQTLLGHEQLSTVQIYTHVNTSHLRKIYDKKHPRS